MTCGLPASGKSTWAKQYIKENPNTKIVNKDSFRAMLDNGKWSKGNEKFVLEVRDLIIIAALKQGKDIIVDDTNFNIVHLKRIEEIAEKHNAEVEIKDSFLDIPLDECIERDKKREGSVGEKVIRGMYDKYLKEKDYVRQDKELSKAVVFDVDGTLTTGPKDRSPYEWSKVGQDELCQEVYNAYKLYKEAGYKIIIFTGRDGCCEKETKEWLKKYNIEYDYFDIRPLGNAENDAIIKERMVKEILDKYYIEVVFDDRNRVCKKWRQLGFKCYQVACGDF